VDNRDKSTQAKGKKRAPLNKGRGGSIYCRGGKLWIDFYYLGERFRESSGLKDTHNNRLLLRNSLDLIAAEIKNGVFKFAERFPFSKKKLHFSRLEGLHIKKDPTQITFREYYKKWWEALEKGMSESQKRDYKSIINFHLLPFFGDRYFSEITAFLVKEFVAGLRGVKNQHGNPISAKRIQNIMIPLRVIIKDAISDFGWPDMKDTYSRIKLPPARKVRVRPFNQLEWRELLL